MDLGLTDRVVIVTGGASNIGRAIARSFGAEGAAVAILDRDASMAERTAREIVAGGGCSAVFVTDRTDVAACAAASL